MPFWLMNLKEKTNCKVTALSRLALGQWAYGRLSTDAWLVSVQASSRGKSSKSGLQHPQLLTLT